MFLLLTPQTALSPNSSLRLASAKMLLLTLRIFTGTALALSLSSWLKIFVSSAVRLPHLLVIRILDVYATTILLPWRPLITAAAA